MTTPAALGYRMPAEWEPHEATWIVWPHNRSDWPGKLSAIHWVYAEIARRLTPDERLRILVPSATVARRAKGVLRRVGVAPSRFELVRFPTDRGWTRDTGPIFIRRQHNAPALAVAGFQFNGWARYSAWHKDALVSERVAKHLRLHRFPARIKRRDVVLEGGAIDVDGAGTLITTEECLLDTTTQVRNPGFDRRTYARVFADYLGVTQVIWLGRGIAGDDTHGHVDDLCRFVGPRTVVLCYEPDPRDPNHRVLEENRERLEGAKLADGSRPDVIRLPMPEPLYFDGTRLPASYANFYIGNTAVLVPTFNDPHDRDVLGILGELFRDRPVVGIHAVDLVWGLGTLHCLTQQQPAVIANDRPPR